MAIKTDAELLIEFQAGQPKGSITSASIRDILDTLAAVRGLVVNIKDAPYLAQGNSHDDTAAINSAIATVHGVGGGAIILPYDTYGLTGPLGLFHDIKFIFLNSTLKALSAFGTMISVPSRPDVSFEGKGTLDGNNLNTTLLDTTNADNLLVRGITFKNVGAVSGSGLRLRGGKNHRIEKSIFDNLTRGVYGTNNGATWLDGSTLKELYFTGMIDAATYMVGDVNGATRDVSISDCKAENFQSLSATRSGYYWVSVTTSHSGIRAHKLKAIGMGTAFTSGGNSDFFSFYDVDDGSVTECDISFGGDGGIVINRARRIQVLGNRTHDNDDPGIAIAGGSIGCIVAENEIYNNNRNFNAVVRNFRGGLHISQSASNTTVEGNHGFDNQAVKTQDFGCVTRSSTNNTIFGANDFKGNKVGEILDEGYGSTPFRKKIDRIPDATAFPALLIGVPNLAISSKARIRINASLGVGGAIGANEASRAVEYDIIITRTPGLAAVAALSAAYGDVTSSVVGGATIAVGVALSAVNGANTENQSFRLNITITRGSGASTNHTCLLEAEVVNVNSSAAVIIDDTKQWDFDLVTALGGDATVVGILDYRYGITQDTNIITLWDDVRIQGKATYVPLSAVGSQCPTRDADGTVLFNGASNFMQSTSAALATMTGDCWCVLVARGVSVTAKREFELSVGSATLILAGEMNAAASYRTRGAVGIAAAVSSAALTASPRIFHSRRTAGVDVGTRIGNNAEVTAVDATGNVTVTQFTLGGSRAGASFSGMTGLCAVIFGKGVYTAAMSNLINAWAQASFGAVLTN